MKIETILKNKLAVYIVAVAICVAGLFCLTLTQISPFPNPSFNNIHIQFSYPGANAETVRTQITQKVVDSLQSIDNIENIVANSRNGSAEISLKADSIEPQDMLQTQMSIMHAIASTHLPAVVPEPEIRVDSGSSGLITFIVRSDYSSLFDINNFIAATLQSKFSSIPGVRLDLHSSDPVVKLQLIPEKLALYHLTPDVISQRVDASYKSTPLGQLYIENQAYPLSLLDKSYSLKTLGNIIVGAKSDAVGLPIYLKDVANISFESSSLVSNYFSSFNGHVADGINLLTSTHANPFIVADTAKGYVHSLQASLPAHMQISAIFDMSQIMRTSINEVGITIAIASLLVLLIALIFLGHLRTTIIPIVTIPICLLGSVIFLTAFGFSINILSLLAMVLAVGLVVDDSIVVVENITRYIEAGRSKYDAIIHGTSDIAFTVLGITATLLAVYLPIAFAGGVIIVFLKAFAVPLAAAVFISGLLALTLTPVMCVTFVSSAPQNNYQRWFDAVLQAIIKFYQKILHLVLSWPKLFLILVLAFIVGGGYMALKLPVALFSDEPTGTVKITIHGSSQDSVQTIRDKAKLFKSFYTSPSIKYYAVYIRSDDVSGELTGQIRLRYKPEYLHENSLYANKINAFIKKNNIKDTDAQINKFMTSGDGQDFTFDVYGTASTAALNPKVEALTAMLKKSPIFSLVNNQIHLPKKQLEFKIDSAKAASVGLFKQQISDLLSIYYGGYTLSDHFNIAGLSVPIVMSLDDADLKDPESISKLQIFSQHTNRSYPLSEFATLETTAKPDIISTYNNQPMVSLGANLASGHSLAEAIKLVDNLMAVNFPQLHYQYTGNADDYLQGSNTTLFIFLLGLVCVYFLMAILFKSLLDPLVIMLTVPFSIVGGALSLYLVGGTLNIFSALGLITLVGLITKHGILIIQFADDSLRQGMSVREAVMHATRYRFRPIIMTTLAMIFGALPLVLSHELLYVSRQALGIVIIGGIAIGTLFSLFIVPLVYTLLKRA